MNKLKNVLITAALVALLFVACISKNDLETGDALNMDVVERTSEAAINAASTSVIEPTPAEDPSEAEIIKEAWSVLNRVGEVHDITLDRKTAEIRDYGSTYEVSIYDAERKEGFGISVHIVEGKPQISRSSIVYWPPDSEGRITMPPAWSPEHLMPIIYVTDEEIIAEGCTVTEGMEYYNTIARLYAEKVAELYRNEKEDSPFYSKEVRISQSVCVDEENKTYRIILAMRGANLPLRMEYSDYTLGFDDGSSDSELLGWVNFGGEIRIWERTDDAWLSRPVFRNNSAA